MGDVGGMVGAHMGEDRCEQGIVLHVFVEANGQTVQGINAANPLVELGTL